MAEPCRSAMATSTTFTVLSAWATWCWRKSCAWWAGFWVGVAGGLGAAQSLTWVAAMLVFYLPMAASVICLNRKMPLEGGLYIWAREAFGDLGGFLTAWNLWVYGIAVTATILYAIPTVLSYLIGPAGAWLPENHLASLGIVTLLIVVLTLAALRGLELGKWIHNIGGMAMLVVFAGLILLPLWAFAHRAPIYYTPFSVAAPPHNLRTLALFGQMLFGALCGLGAVHRDSRGREPRSGAVDRAVGGYFVAGDLCDVHSWHGFGGCSGAAQPVLISSRRFRRRCG